MSPWLAVAIFAGAVVFDAVYASYTIAAARGLAARAATASVLTYALGAAGVLAYTRNPLYIVPAASGAWLGTWLAVRRERPESETPRPEGRGVSES